MTHVSNAEIAEKLREYAGLLELQQANPFRVRAYRRAAANVENATVEVHDLVHRQGRDGLGALPGVGRGIARAVEQLVLRGQWVPLARLRARLAPPLLFRTLPGIGPTLARRIHETLGAATLEALEVAAHDGTLAALPGVGPRRAEMIRAELAARLARPRPPAPPPAEEPPAELLLAVDAEYRAQAAAGALPRIAPRRFNPEGAAWLPILRTRRGPWSFTALFSNTARAHRLGKESDWVVVYFRRDGSEGRRTVVTETRGPLAGLRVVRGREAECGRSARLARAS